MALLRELLQTTTLGRVFSEPGFVVSFDHTTTIGEALEKLSSHHILSAPVVVRPDEGCVEIPARPGKPLVKALIGFVNVGDILHLYLEELKNRGASEDEDGLEAAGQLLCNRPVLDLFGAGATASSTCMLSSNSERGRDWGLKGNVGEPLLSVIRRGFLSPQEITIPTGHPPRVVHRLAVFDCAEDPLNGPPHLLGIFSQMDAVRFLSQHLDQLGPLGAMSLQQLDLAKQPPVTVPHSMETIRAFRTMYDQRVSGVAVLGSDGKVEGNLSMSDLRCLAPGLFSALGLPVDQFLMHRPLLAEVQQELSAQAMETDEEPQGNQAGGGDTTQAPLLPPVGLPPGTSPPKALLTYGTVITCHPGDTLAEVIALLARSSVHRVWVVDAGGKALSCVTLTDILHAVSEACGKQ